MTEDSNNAVSNSFLLDDDSRSVTTIFNNIPDVYYLIITYTLACTHFGPAFSIKLYITHLIFICCSIPFSVDDISKSMEQIDIADIEPPPLIHENSGFSFLLPRAD